MNTRVSAAAPRQCSPSSAGAAANFLPMIANMIERLGTVKA
jgi:hypothetical protein